LLAYLLITYLPLLFFFNTIQVAIQDYFQDDREGKIQSTAIIVAASISKSNYFNTLGDDTKKQLLDAEMDTRSQQGGFRILIFDPHCAVLDDTNNADVGKTLIVPEVLNALEKKNAVDIRSSEQAVYASASIENDVSETVGAVLLVNSVADIYTSIKDIQKTLVTYTVLTAIIMGVLVFVVSQVLIDPLTGILGVVQKMADGHLEQRVQVSGHDEYATLGQAFNEMAEKLEKVDKSREEFVSNVSHELKTPLSSIKVLSESVLLQEDAPKEVYREFLEDINSEVDRMTHMVLDLLQLVKLDEGEVGLHLAPTSLNEMTSDIVKRLTPLAEQKSITLAVEAVREVIIDADELKLSSAISNLVDNGIKYTPNGGSVKIILDADHQFAFITVSDTGIGIKEDEQSRVFDRFYRVDKTRDRETGGTGLGLSITYATVRLHNGVIRLISKENEGSSFVIRIPLRYKQGENI
jgi:signal transduction histidine kinase